MASHGNISILNGASTLGVLSASGAGISFLNAVYRYANLTLPYNPNDPGLTFTYDNSTLVPVVILYARFFNLLNEPSVPLLINVGTSAGGVTGGVVTTCLDVRGFGAIGDGITDDTGAIQKALNQAASNVIGNQALATQAQPAATPLAVQSATGHIENGSGTSTTIQLPAATTVGNLILVVLSAFNYNGTPSVTDSQNNSYAAGAPAVNGELKQYAFLAQVTTAGVTTMTLTNTGKNYNSYIAGIAVEFSGVSEPFTIDAQATSVLPNTNNFVPASIPATKNNDLVISMMTADFAASKVPSAPAGFNFINSVVTPQPNGLNGADPVTAVAFSSSTGLIAVAPIWTGLAVWGGTAVTVALRLTLLPKATPGQTTVCIPQGVNCLVNPVALDEGSFANPSFRYGKSAYSLLISDGVTLEIDGSIVANPSAQFPSSYTGIGPLPWFILMNQLWPTNSTLGTALKPAGTPGAGGKNLPIAYEDYVGGTAFNEGPRNKNIRITGSGKVYLNGGNFIQNIVAPGSGLGAYLDSFTSQLTGTAVSVSTAANVGKNEWALFFGCGDNTTSAPVSGVGGSPSPFATIPGFQSGSPSPNDTTGFYFGQPLSARGTVTGTCGSTGTTGELAGIATFGTNGKPVQVADYIIGSTLTANIGEASGSLDPTVVTVNLPHAVTAGNAILLLFFGNKASPYSFNAAQPGFVPTISTPQGDTFYQLANIYNQTHNSPFQGQLNFGFALLAHIATQAKGGETQVNFTWPMAIPPGGGGLEAALFIGKVAVVELANLAPLNTSTPGANFFPVGLFRGYCCDNSSIDSIEVVAPLGCGIQWGNSNAATIENVFLHDAPNQGSTNPDQAAPGIIEMDMLRSSTVQGNTITKCPTSIAIMDFAGIGNSIASNTMTGDNGGYVFNDFSAEWQWVFSDVFAQNSNISSNRASSCVTFPATTGPDGENNGSFGFRFNCGEAGTFYNYGGHLNCTGITFQNNTGSGNSTDLTYTTYTKFAVLTGNNVSNSNPPVPTNQTGVNGEVPTGTVNGTNVNFTLAHTPTAGTLSVFINGLLEIQGTDFTIAGAVITFAVAPQTGDSVTASYTYS